MSDGLKTSHRIQTQGTPHTNLLNKLNPSVLSFRPKLKSKENNILA
jgi:hypothetical protein